MPAAVDELAPSWRPARVHVVAVGKAAAAMFTAFTERHGAPSGGALVIGPGERPDVVPAEIWERGGHPYPDAGSVAGAERALELARGVPADDVLVLLVSGGASAVMAAPAPGLSLDAKQQAIRTIMTSGGDITALNAVRKHLSAIKGGRLAAACPGRTITLALSDVVGDDLSVIGSGPGVPDGSTWQDALAAIDRFGGDRHRPEVRALVEAGARGERPETPKTGDLAAGRVSGHVIGGRRHAMAAAARLAAACGYAVHVVDAAVVGEARDAAGRWWTAVQRLTGAGPMAVISSGETTVRVTGSGRGGRNQEFALALVEAIAAGRRPGVLVSVGTDGIDGPTDAAGALVDSTTAARAVERGLAAPARYLADNDSARYFDALGDMVRTGPTGTNVGDVQILLFGAA